MPENLHTLHFQLFGVFFVFLSKNILTWPRGYKTFFHAQLNLAQKNLCSNLQRAITGKNAKGKYSKK